MTLPSTVSRPPQTGFLARAAQLASGHAIGYVLTLAVAPLLARLYGPAAFGLFAMFVTAATCLSVMVTCRFDQAILVAKDELAASRVALASLLTTMLGALVLALFSPQLAFLLSLITGSDSPELLVPLLIAAVVCVSLYQITVAWLLRKEQYRDMAAMRFVFAAAMAVTQVAIPLLGGSVLLGLAAGQVVGFGTGTLYGCWRSRRSWPPIRLSHWQAVVSQAQVHQRFALFGVPSALASNWAVHGPVVLLAVLFGVEVAGIFALAQRLFTTPLSLLNSAFSRIFYAEAARTSSSDELAALFRYTLSRVFLLAVLPIAAVACLAPGWFGPLFGAEWAGAGVVCTMLAPMALSMTLAFVVAPTFDVLHRQDQRLWRELLCAALIAGGMVAVWSLGGSANWAIGMASVGGTIGYLLIVAMAKRCISQQAADESDQELPTRVAA